MKRMLIVGAAGVIGSHISSIFSSEYQVVTVSRDPESDFVGDLRDREFLDEIIRQNEVDILINCAGVLSEDFLDVMDVNFMAAGYLTSEFYKKMDAGFIINITSYRANMTAWDDISLDRVYYNVSKSALKKLIEGLQFSVNKKVRVVSVEPGLIESKLSFIKEDKGIDTGDDLRRVSIPVDEIVRSIRFILEEDKRCYVSSLELKNIYAQESINE